MDGEQITLEQALGLLSLPRVIGIASRKPARAIEAGIGRFGPYVRMGAVFGSLDRDDDVLAIGINRAVDLIARKMASVRTLGPHPADKELVAVRKGRFGPYVQHGKTVANLPRGVMMEEITLDEAVALLAEKGKQLRPRGAAGRRGRGAAAAKPEAGRTRTKGAGIAQGQARRQAARHKSQARRTEEGGRQGAGEEEGGGARSEASSHHGDNLRGPLPPPPSRKGRGSSARYSPSPCGEGGRGEGAVPRRSPERTVIVVITGTDPDGDAIARPATWDPRTARRR